MMGTYLEWPFEYWYPLSRTTWRAKGKSSSRRVNNAGMCLQIWAAASFTETYNWRDSQERHGQQTQEMDDGYMEEIMDDRMIHKQIQRKTEDDWENAKTVSWRRERRTIMNFALIKLSERREWEWNHILCICACNKASVYIRFYSVCLSVCVFVRISGFFYQTVAHNSRATSASFLPETLLLKSQSLSSSWSLLILIILSKKVCSRI